MMNKQAFLILLLAVIAIPQSQAAPALGPSIAAGVNPSFRRPVQPAVRNDPRLAERALLAAPKRLKNFGTRGAKDAEAPVYRHRGSAGSMNLTHDIQLRPAF